MMSSEHSACTPILLLDHVNVNVQSWTHECDKFWFEAMGFARDPRGDAISARVQQTSGSLKGVVFANIGLQQFHMPLGEADNGTQPMRNATIGLNFPDIELLRNCLTDHGFGCQEDRTETCPHLPVGRALRVDTPTGVQLRVHSADDWCAPARAREVGAGHPGGPSKGLGMPYVEFRCPEGTAAGIGHFYERIMGIPSESGVGTCRIPMRTGQFLLFRETYDELPAYDGHHIAIYIGDPETADTSASFADVYKRCQQAGVIFNNPRFPNLTYDTLEDALRHAEFRIFDIVDPETGKSVYKLEHEVRSLHHSTFSCPGLLKQGRASQL